MGDAEIALQATKKRAAGRELSRDNPGLDDEEDSSEQEAGTFKRASDEVLATRRIVKVRRQPQTSAPSSNPFAGIKLVPPTESNLTKREVTADTQAVGEQTVCKDVDEKIKSSNENEQGEDKENPKSEENNEAESKAEVVVDPEAEAEAKLAPESKAESAAEGQNSAEEKSASVEVKPVAEIAAAAEEDKAENDEKKDGKTENGEKKDENTPLSSFQQLSSSQNAFTNLSGTGFSTSTFSFGSIASGGSGSGSGFGQGSGPLFGLKTDQPSFGLGLSNNGNSSLFGTSSSSLVSKSEGNSTPPMKEVEVATGEENEEVVFNADSILYEFMDGGWKERGKGEVKINVSKPEKEKARLVMRARGNYRLILNASLFPDMKLTPMEKKGLSFTCMNSTGDATGVFSTYALKFKDPSIVDEFRASVAAYKGKTETTTNIILKTPDNSPKAADD